ncbi:hypothetical protein QBC43DRAFT_370029 [Cladorrhinum sp. PSN259]|nr:hypothetical protein QBC43DRAFT_370029 [Cladorrhinum sp. PSN259]
MSIYLSSPSLVGTYSFECSCSIRRAYELLLVKYIALLISMLIQLTSARAAYAQHALNNYILKKTGRPELLKLRLTRPRKSDGTELPSGPDYTGRICIVGAGACGLYLAMMLKYLGYGNVDILEANERIGGRCFTYPQPGDTATHSYYDVGAMRIPDIPWMQHVLEFVRDTLGLQKKVVSFIYDNRDKLENTPVCYNYKHEPIEDGEFEKIMADFSNPFLTDFDKAFADWTDPNSSPNKDQYSTRAWLMLQNGWTYDDTSRAEIYHTSTGLFDQSLTETVIDYADFAAVSQLGRPWWRIDGGMQTITDTMQQMLASSSWPPNCTTAAPTLSTNTPVTAMALGQDKDNKTVINVTTAASSAPVTYDIVFNTTAMAPLQQINLGGLNLPDEILTGIRTLSYDRATKVAIKFKSPWWFKNNDKSIIWGGVSKSDLPISNVVYPSWNDGPDSPAVLMVSYSWAQGATRMGSLVQDYTLVKPSLNDPILKLCIQNLATLWEETELKPSVDFLMSQVLDDGSPCAPYHAWSWANDPWTGGAFALFGPGQFQNVYPAFIGLQAQGHLALCGEALSAHHGWISGAWASAYMQLMAFLKDRGQDEAVEKLKKSPFGGGSNYHPEEMHESLLMNLLQLRQEERVWNLSIHMEG